MGSLTKYEDVKDITIEDYYKDNAFAVDMFKSKYSHTKDSGEKETPARVWYRVASGLSTHEMDKQHYIDVWFDLMYNDWFRPGGSIISGVDSGRNESLLNCTTIPIEGDTLEDISNTYYALMKCAAYRQGMGVDLSVLRYRGSKVGNAAEESTGVVPWGKKFSNVGVYVGQRGRMPALLESLIISHPDIEEFIISKTQKGEIENANISVQVTDGFMECLKDNRMWKLQFTTDRETFEKEIDPNYLIDLIASTAAQSAEPGVQFIDLMRRGSMVNVVYEITDDSRFKIVSTNACSEKPLPPYGNCNLGSINAEAFSTDPKQYKQQLKNIAPYIVRMLDNVIDYELDNNKSPLQQQAWILRQAREIGLGITNLHDWLLKQDLQYDSDEAIDKVENFFKYYTYYIFEASVELGKEKGSCPAFEKITSKDLYENSIYFRNIIDEFYGGDYSKITHLRNLAHISIAPVGSISNTFSVPCISSGIEPVIAPWYWRRTRAISKGAYDYYFVVPERVKEYVLSHIPENTEDYNKIYEFSGSVLDNDGKTGKELIRIITTYISDNFFKPAHEIDYNKKIELLSRLYKWTDAAISCSFNLPVTATEEDVKNIYLGAYEKGVRAVSVYREGSREGILIFEDPVTHKNNYDKKDTLCLDRPEDIVYHCAPKRPDHLDCNIHHTTVKGEKWLVLIGLLNGKPYELFAGQDDELALPKSVEKGIITKNDKGRYNLSVKIRKREVEHKDIANVLMSAEQRTITRMLSACLRHGVPVEFITEQLKKAKEDITDFASAVSRVLGKYETEGFENKETCPVCGEQMTKHEGCLACVSCSYSKCG